MGQATSKGRREGGRLLLKGMKGRGTAAQRQIMVGAIDATPLSLFEK